MTTLHLMPLPFYTMIDGDGAPISGCLLYTYQSGTSTPQPVYADGGGTTALTNPVQADANGRFPPIYLLASAYKFIFTMPASPIPPPSGPLPAIIQSIDPVGLSGEDTTTPSLTILAGEPLNTGDMVYLSHGDGGKTAGSWYRTDATLAYASINASVIATVDAPIAAAATGLARLQGTVPTSIAVSPGIVYYLSTVPGGITATPPPFVRAIGTADGVDTLAFNPSPPWPEMPVPISQTATDVGTVENFVLTPGPHIFIRANNPTPLTLGGFKTGIDGLLLDIFAVGAGDVTLLNESPGSDAQNRIITGQSADLSLPALIGRASLLYDATSQRWRNTTAAPLEGPWTPVIGGVGGESGQTYAHQVGSWVKNGRIVIIWCDVEFTNKGIITGPVQIKGLPFESAHTGGYVAVVPVGFAALATQFVTVNAILLGASKEAYLDPLPIKDTTNVGINLLTGDLTNTSRFLFSMAYISHQ